MSSRGGAIEEEVYIEKAPATLLRSDGQDSGMRSRFEAMIRQRQDEICAAISALDGTPFREDSWTRPGGGGGISRVIQGGNVRAWAASQPLRREGRASLADTGAPGGRCSRRLA